jgi:hypothetical protein
MNYKNVVQALQSEKAGLEKQINQIDLALSALGNLDGHGRGRGRRGGRRNLSAAARASIAAAQRKRWAVWKAKHK